MHVLKFLRQVGSDPECIRAWQPTCYKPIDITLLELFWLSLYCDHNIDNNAIVNCSYVFVVSLFYYWWLIIEIPEISSEN